MYAAEPAEAEVLAFLEPLARFPVPGMGAWGPVRDLARVGAMLLDQGRSGDRQVIGGPAAAALTATQLSGPDAFVDGVVPYGFGVVTSPAVFGRDCSHRTYGHSGGNTSMLMVDPHHRLVAAFYWNGRVSAAESVARHHATTRAIYRDLGLTAAPAS
jgi:CubicO group peptidase (beta-lactamase class C family)